MGPRSLMSEPGQQSLNVTVIHCRRGRVHTKEPCSAPSCTTPHTRFCDFPLRGRKAGRTCDAKLCDSHATCAAPGKHHCPPHAILTLKENAAK